MDDLLVGALSAQYTHERENAAFYEAVANSFEGQNWRGFAAWCYAQAAQEREHAQAFRVYLIDRNYYPALGGLAFFPLMNGDPLLMFQGAMAREKGTSAKIRELYYLAGQVEDPETEAWLQPWLLEQVEEERSLLDILGDLEHAGADGAALLLLDRELGKRGQ